jgi:hypothetical protein
VHGESRSATGFAGALLVVTNYYLILNSWAIALTPEWLLRRL